jgi:hypothetical protein
MFVLELFLAVVLAWTWVYTLGEPGMPRGLELLAGACMTLAMMPIAMLTRGIFLSP